MPATASATIFACMALGEKIADGSGTAIYAFGEGRVVKLFSSQMAWIADHEARITRLAFEAGAPVPEVLDTVTVDGQPGIVFPRYDGPTLGAEVLEGRIAPEEGARMMARLHHALHAANYRPVLHNFHEWGQYTLSRLRRRGLPDDVLDKAQSVLLRLPENGVLCHGDFHAHNVLLTKNGPQVIDWVTALNGNPLVDVARQQLMLTLFMPDDAIYDPVRGTELHYLDEYARLSGTTPNALNLALVPYLVVMATTRMTEAGSKPGEQRKLMAFIRATEV